MSNMMFLLWESLVVSPSEVDESIVLASFPGKQVGGLPGKRRVAGLLGNAQGLTTIRLSLAPLPGGESDLAAQRVKPRDVLHGAGGSGLDESSLHLGQCPVGGPQSQEGVCN